METRSMGDWHTKFPYCRSRGRTDCYQESLDCLQIGSMHVSGEHLTVPDRSNVSDHGHILALTDVHPGK